MRRVLIVGSGAREHALAWKLAQSPEISELYVAPGNPGTATVAANVSVAADDASSLARLVDEKEIGLTVVGPEAALAAGLPDVLRQAGRAVVGPSLSAFRLEGSKAFAKAVMKEAGVPTAACEVFDDQAAAVSHLASARYPLVVKADGLAAGKGVGVCADEAEARRAVTEMLVQRRFGGSGARIVIEEYLEGREVSLMALVDGERAVPLPLSQDHKRLIDGDLGPNTGGMGAYVPVPLVSDEEAERLVELSITPVVAWLAVMGHPYRGVLYAGLMLTTDGPKVLEYNCRLGDPETQVILPLLEDDLLPWMEAVATGRLSGSPAFSSRAALGVVLASEGYPGKVLDGKVIEGLDEPRDDVLLFHAGTALDASGRVVTAGGRVLTVVGVGDTLAAAAAKAYGAPVRFEGMQRRLDIGHAALDGARDASPGFSRPSHEPPSEPPPSYPPDRPGSYASLPSIAVMASGDGSNLQALIDAAEAGTLKARIACVISHKPGAGSLDRARRHGIPVHVVKLADRRDPDARRVHEDAVIGILNSYSPDAVVLAGWMLILTAQFLDRVACPIVNVHPALLPVEGEPLDIPVIKGAHAVRDALEMRLPYTGVSVHHAGPEVDSGEVILRERVDILPEDDEAVLYARLKPVEHRLLVEAVDRILTERFGGIYA